VVAVHLYFRLANQLHAQSYTYVREEAEILSEMARFPDFDKLVAHETHLDSLGEEYVSHYVRLLDSNGKVIIETPTMKELIPIGLFPESKVGGRLTEPVTVRGGSGASFLITSTKVDWQANGLEWETLQVALDVTNVEKILARSRRELAAGLFAGLLICSVAGIAVARRGIRPLREITEQARQISVANLNERLNGADWPLELNIMAGALNGMLDRIESSFSRLYNSVANLSHKLRTPITILRGEAEVALARDRSAGELRETITSSIEEFGRLARLVDNIIFISQAEAGKLQHVLIKINVRAEIDKVLEFYGPLADEKGISITCDGSATLSADPTLFRKAIAHLVSNARTYSNAGGSIAISVRQGDDGSAYVSVTDTGCGIAEEDMPKIFDRFYRVYDSRFMDPHGSGLGLPLVKTIMDLHRGTIEITSRPGQGTKVILKFPPV
jgi:two-component system heavy metal sensor histidine kinase CusS